MPNETQIDAFPPAKLASRMEEAGATRAGLRADVVFALALLGGVFIALGASFTSAATTGLTAAGMGAGAARLLGGLAFCLGIIAVVLTGAELFAGNHLSVMALAGGRVTWTRLMRNWALVFAGNVVGAAAIAVAVFLAQQHFFSAGAFGANALEIANFKCGLGFGQAFLLGVLGSMLIGLALWLAFSARSATDKILVIAFPIAAFVAAGFEYAIPNVYWIPLGLFIKYWASASFWQLEAVAGAGLTQASLPDLTWGAFLLNNLLPVAIGNLVGGAGLVGLVYWSIFLRPRKVVEVKKEARVPNILVVDDDPDFVEVTTMILEKEGYKFSTAYNGKEAWASMAQKKPDMVLLDVMMSTTLEGVDLARRMSADAKLKDVPIIMISSIDSTYHAGKLPDNIQLPIDAWLSKPVNPELLLKTVRRFLA
jgi:formate transporter